MGGARFDPIRLIGGSRPRRSQSRSAWG